MNDNAGPTPTTSRFAFTGRSGEYFRIWVVSLFLSIVTLGIYSAWGKVRKRRYIYAHTELDGTGFEYRASPLAILRGRVIALFLFGGFALSSHFFPLMQLAFALLLLLLAPWIIVAASRFNARNSAWRNIAFGFDGGIGEAARVFLGLGAIAMLTLGLGIPYFRMRRSRFIIEHHRFGTTQFRGDLVLEDFILAYLLAFLMLLFIIGVAAVLAVGVGRTGRGAVVGLVPLIVVYATYVVVFAYLRARIGNATFNGIVVGPLRCHSALRARDLAWLYLSNIVAILATLGLATPWVTVRMVRYRADKLCLVGESALEVFAGAPTAGTSATGSEVSDLFDVDVSV